jgi:penicillin-binding protein-related factor A (putative recombinase)
MKRKKPNAMNGKTFETDVLKEIKVAVRRGYIVRGDRTPDGVSYSGFTYCQTPSDFVCLMLDGRLCYLEAKSTKDKSVSVQPTRSEWEAMVERNPDRKVTDYNRAGGLLRRHQLTAMLDAHRAGGVGLLVVHFDGQGVFAMNGVGLDAWERGDDAGSNLASISLAHFRDYGWLLGTASDWQFEEVCFGYGYKPGGKG